MFFNGKCRIFLCYGDILRANFSMTYIGDNLILLWASPKTAGNFVDDVLDKSSLSEIYGPVDIECSLASGSPSVNARKKVKSTGQRTR